MALHPSNVASSLVEGNLELSIGLEWVRTFALQVIESDTDRECYTVSNKRSLEAQNSCLHFSSSPSLSCGLYCLCVELADFAEANRQVVKNML